LTEGHTARCWIYSDDPQAPAKRAENALAVKKVTDFEGEDAK
jgi:hypothetical protein